MRSIPKSCWALAACSGLLQILIFPSPSLPFLCWVGLVPLLVAVLKRYRFGEQHRVLSDGQAFLIAYLCGIIWYAGTCYWIYHVMASYGGLAPLVSLGILVLFCLYLSLYHGLFGFAVSLIAKESRDPRAVILLIPFLWVAVELARARITRFPWDLLGTALVDDIPISRIATVTGVYGLSFVVVLVNAVFAYGFLSRSRPRQLVITAALAAAVAFEAGILARPPQSRSTHSARLVQQNVPILDSQQWTSDYFDHTVAGFLQLSANKAQDNVAPALIIWPESPAPFWGNDPRFHQWMEALAESTNAYLIVGNLGINAMQNSSERYRIFNSAVLVSPQGEFVARYDKVHLVPFGEYVPFKSIFVFAQKLTKEVGDFVPGLQRIAFNVEGHRIGTFICYESIFPDEVREFSQNGAELLVNISNDGWFGHSGAPGQHLNMARMRAIENRRWLLRATNTGITVSIDPYGRVVLKAPREQRTAIDAPYSFESGTTFYTRHGDVFAWACAIISFIALALTVLRGRNLNQAGRTKWLK